VEDEALFANQAAKSSEEEAELAEGRPNAIKAATHMLNSIMSALRESQPSHAQPFDVAVSAKNLRLISTVLVLLRCKYVPFSLLVCAVASVARHAVLYS